MSEHESTHEVAERTSRDGSTTRTEKTTTSSKDLEATVVETPDDETTKSGNGQKQLEPDGR